MSCAIVAEFGAIVLYSDLSTHKLCSPSFLLNSQLCYPPKNRKLRDELSHNLFLMIQECNKFREHQAREILISTLQQQLERREEGLAVLKGQIREAEEALVALNKFREG